MKNITRIPVIYWIINKLICAKQRFVMFTMITIRTISISPFNIPGVFMEINRDRKVTYYAI